MRRFWASVALGCLPLCGCARGSAVTPANLASEITPLPPIDGSPPPPPQPAPHLSWWKSLIEKLKIRDAEKAAQMPPPTHGGVGDNEF